MFARPGSLPFWGTRHASHVHWDSTLRLLEELSVMRVRRLLLLQLKVKPRVMHVLPFSLVIHRRNAPFALPQRQLQSLVAGDASPVLVALSRL